MCKDFSAAAFFLASLLLVTTAHGQTYVGGTTFPDVNYSETFFPADPDGPGQIEVTCTGESSLNYSDMVVQLSPPSIAFTISGSRTNVTGDPRFCMNSQGSFPFEVANVSVSDDGVSGQNNAATLFVDLLFNADGSALQGIVNSTGNFDGQQLGEATLALADVYQINATGTSEDRGGGLVTTSDWTLVFEDQNNDGLLQVDEIISFSGATVTTISTFVYDTMVGTPDLAGVSTSSGFDSTTLCCWWFAGPVVAEPTGTDGWFPNRWTYVLSIVDPGPPDADGDGVDNNADLCPATLPGDLVDANGCSADEAVDLVVAAIFALIDSPVSDKARDKLGKARDKLNDALTELAQGDVKKGLKKIGDAVKELLKAEKEGVNVGDLIDQLVELARAQARAKIDEAIAAGGDSTEIAKAQNELAKAEDELANGKPDKAIDHYAQAWDQAQKA